MKLYPFILLLLTSASAFAQQTQRFYDYQWKETDVAHARFYSVMEPTDSGWHRMDYFLHEPSSLQMEGWFEDTASKVGNGKFTYVYPNKKILSTGYNLHGKKQGLWLSFHPNGMMADSTIYDNGNQTGTRLAWYATGYISDSSVLQKDGSGVQVGWFDNGTPSYAGMLSEGRQQHGKWKYWHKNGKVSAIEIYDHGKLLDKQYFDTTGSALTDTTTKDRNAAFKGGTKDWLKYLGNHLTFPENYRITNSDLAVVELTMTVDEDGNVQDAFINVPFYPPFEKIALDVVRRSPKWTPAISHNRRVRSTFRQAVVFSQPEQ